MNDSLHFDVIPKSRGEGFSTRIAFQDDLSPEVIIAEVAAETGQTVAQVAAVGTGILRRVIIAGRRGRRVRRLFALLSFTPRCGGSFTTVDFLPTVENMNLAINAALSPEGEALFHEGITFERDRVLGEKTPEVLRAYDATSRTINTLTPGGAFKVSGRDFGPEPAVGSTTTGLFVRSTGGGNALTRIVSYSEWTPTEILGAWPAGGLSGDQQLVVVTKYEGSSDLRTFIYGTNLPLNGL